MSEQNVASLPLNNDAPNHIPNTSISRRTSCSSEQSSPVSCASPSYDSGNFSGCNTSDLSIRPISYSSEDDAPIQQIVQRLQSEVERLAKSERWYKNELRIQKRSRIELLEKLYSNEQKFTRENQKLQIDYRRMYALSDKSERRSAQEKDDIVKQFRQLKESIDASKGGVVNVLPTTQSPNVDDLRFELQRQQSIVEDNENVIRTLRDQRKNLLNELRTMATDRDAKLLEIEKKMITLQYENRAISLRCLAMDKERQALANSARINDEIIQVVEQVKTESQERLNEMDRLAVMLTTLNHSKESEIQALKDKSDTASGKLDQLHTELQQQKSSCAEKQLRNEHLEAEIEQYRKMRANFDKYVALLQGNSVELDSKCMEVENLESVIKIQTAQISELNKFNEDAKVHWQHVAASLRNEIEFKDDEMFVKQQLLTDLETKKSIEIKTLRNRLGQLERLNEKLIGQLNRNNADMSKNVSQIVELKNVIGDLNELSVENAQLREQFEVRNDDLIQSKSHEAFIAQLEGEIRSLKNIAEEESNKVDSLMAENFELKAMLERKEEQCRALKQRSVRDSFKSHLCEQSVHSESIQPFSDRKELQKNNEQQIERYEYQKISVRDILGSSQSWHVDETEFSKDILKNTEIVRETSRQVSEICDSGCQASNSDEVEDLRLLYKVLESEYRKQLSRYELHICTLLSKIKSYRMNCAKEKSREQKILELRQQLDTALKRGSDVSLYKKMNLQLKKSLIDLTDDYRKIHQNRVLLKPIQYKELYKLIDESDQFVPNCNRLSESIADLKNDFLRLRTITTTSNFHQPVKRLSLMDELKATKENFKF